MNDATTKSVRPRGLAAPTRMVQDVSVNYWAITSLVPVSLGLGFLWYSPWFLGSAWMRLIGKRKEELDAGGPWPLVQAAFAAWIAAWVLAHVLAFAETRSAIEGMLGACFAWLGFNLTVQAVHQGFERRPYALLGTNAAFHLVEYVAFGAVLGAWR